MSDSPISPAAIGLTGLAFEYCRLLEGGGHDDIHSLLAEVLRYLPRIYITAQGLKPYGEDEAGDDNGAIVDMLDEDGYERVRQYVAAILGQYDTYLDTMVEDMRFSDTPVAVSLSEQLSDIYQVAYDFAESVRQAPSEAIPDITADFKYRFDAYLSQTICSAMRAADLIYHNELE